MRIDLLFLQIADFLQQEKSAILKILTKVATYASVLDEIERAQQVLRNGWGEIQRENPPTIEKMAVFHPSNALLYSYILYGVIPSAFVKEIYIRPSQKVKNEIFALDELIGKSFGLSIFLTRFNQTMFIENMVQSDVVVFTGKYENSLLVKNHFPNSLFLFFGSGTNPTIIGENALVEEILPSLIQSRMFNTGQDCLCSNIFFIHESVAERTVDLMKGALSRLRFGERGDPAVDYSFIYYEKVVDFAQEYLAQQATHIIYQGRVDPKNQILDPVILLSNISDPLPPIEFFSPVFNLVIYEEMGEVNDWLLQSEQLEKALGLTIFGDGFLDPLLERHYTIVRNQTLFQAENGNYPFGGYGKKANYIAFGNQFKSEPILISREVAAQFRQLEHNDKELVYETS